MKYNLSAGLFNAATSSQLKDAAVSFFTKHNLDYTVNAVEDGIEISPTVGEDIDIADDFSCAMAMCNSRRAGKARKLLKSVIERRPLFADAYRNLAQVEM